MCASAICLVGEHYCSVKVMGTNIGAGDVERNNSLGFDVNNSVLILKRSFNQEESIARYNDAVLLEYIGCEDDVGDAGFVFEREKDEALGCAGTLAGDDAAGDADGLIATSLHEFVRRQDAMLMESISVICHRVWACGKAGSHVIRCEALIGCHLLQGCRIFIAGVGAVGPS